MLPINLLRQNKELVKERLAAKYFSNISLVDDILSLDEQVRTLKVQSETLQATANAASKEIGMLMGKGEKEKAEQKKQEVAANKLSIQQLTEQLAAAEKQLKW
jgi:seryl-tRNA synthetase